MADANAGHEFPQVLTALIRRQWMPNHDPLDISASKAPIATRQHLSLCPMELPGTVPRPPREQSLARFPLELMNGLPSPPNVLAFTCERPLRPSARRGANPVRGAFLLDSISKPRHSSG